MFLTNKRDRKKMLLRKGAVLTYYLINTGRGWDENGRGERKGESRGFEKDLWIIKGGIDSQNSEGRREFWLFRNGQGFLRSAPMLF
jgi:hypothetical protein